MRTTFWTSLPALAMGAPRAVQTTPVVAERAAPLSAGLHRGPNSETAMAKSTYPIYIAAEIQERAALPADEALGAAERPRVLHVVASTGAEDSHDSVLVQNWDLTRYKANPVVLWAHRRDEIPIGTATVALVDAQEGQGRQLEADITFPPPGKFPRSDEVWDAWEAGLLRAVSVGFKPHTTRWERISDREVLFFDDLELLEISFVPVGSNPETLAAARERALAERGTTETTPAAAVAALARQPAAEAATPQEHSMDPKFLARDLGLPEDATETQIRSLIAEHRTAAAEQQALLDAVGAPTVDAARGAIEAGRVASAELPKAQARVAELEKDAEDRERAAVIAQLESERRITPAQRDGFCKAASIETLRAFAESAPVIIAASQHREAPVSGATGPAAPVTHAGKAYEDLTGPERISLRETDKEAFGGLRNDWLSRGQPISKSAG